MEHFSTLDIILSVFLLISELLPATQKIRGNANWQILFSIVVSVFQLIKNFRNPSPPKDE